MKWTLTAILAGLALAAGNTFADVVTLASFAFDGTAASLNTTVTSDGATASVFGEGANVNGALFNFASRFGSNANRAYSLPEGPARDGSYTSADNLSDGEYMTFTVTAQAPATLNLANLAFRASRNGGGSTINQLDLYVRVDGGTFTKVGATVALADVSNPGTTNRDLTGPAYQGVNSVAVAFVFFNGYLNKGYLDDIVLTGEVVPPSGTVLLLR